VASFDWAVAALSACFASACFCCDCATTALAWFTACSARSRSGSADNLFKAWDLVDGEEKKIDNLAAFPLEVTSVHYVGYSDVVLLTTGDGTARLVRDTGGTVRDLDTAGKCFLYAAAVTPDGQTAIAGGEDGTLRVWDLREGRLLTTFPAAVGEASK